MSDVLARVRLTRRRLLAAAPVAAAGLRPLAVRAQPGTPATAGGEGWTFTDDRGITLNLPEMPTRIVAQTTSAAALWDLGIRSVAIFGPSRNPDGTPDFQAGNIDLDAVEVVGDYGQMDLEKLVALQADLYVDLTYSGTLWYLGETEEQVRRIVPTLGISMQRRSILEAIKRFEDLAAALGADLQAPAIVDAKQRFSATESVLKQAIAAKPNLSVVVVSPTVDNVYVASPSWIVDLHYLRDIGLNIIDPAPVAESTPEHDDKAFTLISWEQIGQYSADIILVDARISPEDLQKFSSNDLWNALPAVQAGQVGKWYAAAPYSYDRLVPILEELTALIQTARADLV
ncbi:MAG: ABC transporter substrate-binding protein [Thermomicrobiales bacterium]|nr:MAG: ABC transporter substrate-binding protein [Thermomicrobiales bacterium]